MNGRTLGSVVEAIAKNSGSSMMSSFLCVLKPTLGEFGQVYGVVGKHANQFLNESNCE